MKAIDELIKDANSILATLDKDYEAMQSQKSDTRQDQVDKFDDLCENMGAVLGQYSKTVLDFRSKIDRSYDAEGTTTIIYEYPNTDKILTMTPILYWTGGPSSKFTFYIKLLRKPKGSECCYDSEALVISEAGIAMISDGFDSEKGFSDAVSVFLNHCPTYEQLDTAFQTALTNFIKFCVTHTQKRNEGLADKIKTITA